MKYMLVAPLAFWLVLGWTADTPGQIGIGRLTTVSDGEFSVTSGKMSIQINPAVGARIVSLKLGNYEFLTGPEIMPGNYGSTFWPSPQSQWKWPPPAVLDNEPYSPAMKGDTLEFVSGKDGRTGLRVAKEFFPRSKGRVGLDYTMINVADSVIRVAPWEITRVQKGGLFFFPVGNNPLGKKTFEPVPVRVIDGIAWYRDCQERPSQNLLTTADGTEGWAAYAIDGRLFVKKFPSVSRRHVAPGEGEIALYVSKEADYLEFEIQGAYGSLKPGGRSTWHVEWLAVGIPKGISVEFGSSRLVDFTRSLPR